MSLESRSGPYRGDQSLPSKPPEHEAPKNFPMGGVTKVPGNPPASASTSGMPTGAQTIAEDAQQKVGEAVDQVREKGKSQLSSQKDLVAGSVGNVAHALRETGKQLKQGDGSPIAEYVDRAAEKVEQLSTHLSQHNVGELIGDTERFARRQPALFLGGAFLIGLAAARFLKSSAPEPSPVTPPFGPTATTPYRPPATAPYLQDSSTSYSNRPRSS